MTEQNKVYQILKYGNYLPNRQNIDYTKYTAEERRVCSLQYPDGIYGTLAELIETEYNISFTDWCDMYGYDSELSVCKPIMKE